MDACKKIIIFGASDIEAERARKIAKEVGLTTATATCNGEKVNPGTAYKADGYIIDDNNGDDIESSIVFECSRNASGKLPVLAICDHHNPGDPGFNLGPKEYLKASSLGQLLSLLEIEATQEDKVIAAADHCLTAAYQGECPDVTAELILALRLQELSQRYAANEAEVLAGIEEAKNLIMSPWSWVEIAKESIPDLRQYGVKPYLLEAGTITGLAFLGCVDTRNQKKVMLNGSSTIIKDFLDGTANDLGIVKTYGNPNRGFAGGTQQ